MSLVEFAQETAKKGQVVIDSGPKPTTARATDDTAKMVVQKWTRCTRADFTAKKGDRTNVDAKADIISANTNLA